MNESKIDGIFLDMGKEQINESRGQRIKLAREATGLTQEQLADRLGVSRGATGNWELGKGISFKNLKALSDLSGASIEWLADGSGTAPKPGRLGGGNEISKAATEPHTDTLGERDLKVFAAVEGGDGYMIINSEPIDIVQRPWYLKEVRDGYAVLVVGDSMIPAFEPGDMAVVNPKLPPMKGVDMIFISEDEQGQLHASIKRLVRWDADGWHVLQFNPPEGAEKEFVLSRSDWPKALRVVGKFYGR